MDGELERRIARLRQGDHLCLIYRSAAEQTAALVPYLKAGFAAGERCLFVGHGTSGRRLEHALDEAGVDVTRRVRPRRPRLPDPAETPGSPAAASIPAP